MSFFSDWFEPEETQEAAENVYTDSRRTCFNPEIPPGHLHNHIAFSRPGEYSHLEGGKTFEHIVRLMIEGLFDLHW